MISKRIERTLPLLLAAQQRNRALLENVSVIYLCIILDPLSLYATGYFVLLQVTRLSRNRYREVNDFIEVKRTVGIIQS